MTRGYENAFLFSWLAAAAVVMTACGADGADEPPATAVASDIKSTPLDDPCTARLVAGVDRKCTYRFNGNSRTFLVYTPVNYNPSAAPNVIIDAHGATETAEQHAGLSPFDLYPTGLGSGFRLVADREGLVVVTPQGIGNAWDQTDVSFILDVQAKVARMIPSGGKFYMSGISNGGELSYWTGCKNTGPFRGFAPISGDLTLASCPLAHPLPLIAFHSADDILIPYDSGKQSAATWAKADHCRTGPVKTMTFGGANTDTRPVCLAHNPSHPKPWSLVPCSRTAAVSTCESWQGCDAGSNVTFCTVNGATQQLGGHILYFNDTSLSLAAVAWEFFKSQP